jgi:NAD-dependent dihydropyrimidine dehydrogenase PreA subunit
MTTKMVRKIIRIDESKCNGCGLCVPSCAEGALQIIDGKARLIKEQYCDGLGACLGECPEGALTIEERVADDFDEEAVELHLHAEKPAPVVTEKAPCGCPGEAVTQFARGAAETPAPVSVGESRLTHWPVQLTLVPPIAPFLQGADLLLTADCVPFAYPAFHQEFLTDHALVIACPKLDDFEAHLDKLTRILEQAQPKSLTVVHMEVPCCFGLVQMAKQALLASGRDIPFKEVTIGVRGEVKS